MQFGSEPQQTNLPSDSTNITQATSTGEENKTETETVPEDIVNFYEKIVKEDEEEEEEAELKTVSFEVDQVRSKWKIRERHTVRLDCYFYVYTVVKFTIMTVKFTIMTTIYSQNCHDNSIDIEITVQFSQCKYNKNLFIFNQSWIWFL